MKKNVSKSFWFVCLGLITAVILTSANIITVSDPPGIPIVIDVQKDQCTIKFSKPSYDGGAKITGYIIEGKEEKDENWSKKNERLSTRLEYTILNLKEGSRMQFRVTAYNAAGPSKPSAPCDPITIRDHQ